MKLIVAGKRDFDPTKISELISWYIKYKKLMPVEIVSGTATGVDAAGELYAYENSLPIKKFTPEWEIYGKAAGPIRNKEMAEYADAVLLIWDGRSPGSRSMRQEMEKINKTIYEIILND
jgi:YspA, cpYpsA-related SLOG family